MRHVGASVLLTALLPALLATPLRAGERTEDAEGVRASAPATSPVPYGPPTVEALLLELGARDVALRRTALQALGQAGLRTPAAQEALRRHAREADAAEARLAVEALGRVGNGADVDLLLGTLEDPDTDLRAAAWRALQILTDLRLPPSPTRWARWWDGHRRLALRTLPGAVRDVEQAVARGRDASVPGALLAELGWIDQPLAERTALRWLRAADARLRGEGFALAAALRLGALAGEVESALPFANDLNREAADRAARALGLTW